MSYLKKAIKLLFLGVLFVLQIPTVSAKVGLPAIYGDHMVLQQDTTITFWGWGKPFEEVKVSNSWSSDTVSTIVNQNGNWDVQFQTPEAGGSHNITVQGYNKIEIKDILMGDVWICSGQSNMEWSVNHGFINGDSLAKEATEKEIRLFHVEWRSSPYPCLDVKGHWEVCSPETVRDFSAIGYFFGKEIYSKTGIPMGLISSNWGGTPVESWIPEYEIRSRKKLYDAANKVPYFPWAPNKPGVTYNAMISPLMPLAIKGAIWYQGEANVDNSYAYTDMLQLLVESWREVFGSDLDFYFAQIAPYMHYQNESGVEVRDAQRRALDVIPNSVMVILSDIGDTTDIHPRKKYEAGIRFGQAALNKTYGNEEFPLSGPIFKTATFDGKKVEVSFCYGEGLMSPEKEVELFELAGEDLKWYPAKAVIKNDKVVVTCKKVPAPAYVRFAWSNAATPQLFNKDHLPASSFTTYEWRNIKHSL